jgi:hypothetical protein
MIHHASIAVNDPEHVAHVLAELLGGYAGPFIGPIPGAWVAYAEDDHGTGIELYPRKTSFLPGKGNDMGVIAQDETPEHVPFHVLLSVKVDRATIESIGAREGWRTVHMWRGPSPDRPLFELYEFWIENRIMFELVTPDMIPAYARLTNRAAQQKILAAMSRARPAG